MCLRLINEETVALVDVEEDEADDSSSRKRKKIKTKKRLMSPTNRSRLIPMPDSITYAFSAWKKKSHKSKRLMMKAALSGLDKYWLRSSPIGRIGMRAKCGNVNVNE
jgi:hypothetical protein